ncbi:MAG: phytoene desaturase [Cytophagales bacterium]|nr:MAG: phytoene desaturase [Cytophagales bacterium]TAF61541.1 MAG: phytoene desaturase [Cytophagales bacterium]
MTKQKVLVVGAGLGGLCTALRLAKKGFAVEILEKHHQAGGRLNQIKQDGFTFDVGPSFFSMSYEFDELFKSCNIANPLSFNELDPLYAVYFSDKTKPYLIHKDLKKLALEFPNEKDFELKAKKYLAAAKGIFHDTEYRIVKRNYNSLFSYAKALASVPLKHAPKLFKNMWSELESHFTTQEVKVIFSLVAFFLGATPFDTPAVYSLLNYTELEHDGYWNVQGGMYKIVEVMLKELQKEGVKITYHTEIVSYESQNQVITGLTDKQGHTHVADLYVINADAAAFRGKIFKQEKFSTEKLDKMDWTLAPFTIYLGVKGKIPNFYHHNYFLGSNFNEYADKIFKSSVAPEKPYYYVNVSSVHNPDSAPENCENLFILCPVPDLRYKKDWNDAEGLADNIVADLGKRIGYDILNQTLTRKVMPPTEWESTFNLYRGSGLGLAHGLNQVAAMRPANKDEKYKNVYYVGASTVPGTGLPIVVISSRLVQERIEQDLKELVTA